MELLCRNLVELTAPNDASQNNFIDDALVNEHVGEDSSL